MGGASEGRGRQVSEARPALMWAFRPTRGTEWRARASWRSTSRSRMRDTVKGEDAMFRFICAIAVVIGASSAPAYAITLGQVETFSGPDHFWSGGGVVPDGGPAGAGDAYLRVVATPPTEALNATNRSQWSGDYISAGVTSLEMDLINQGTSELSIRLIIYDASGPGGGSLFASTQARVLQPGTLWQRVTFGLASSELTWLGTGSGDLQGALMNVDAVFLRHQVGPPSNEFTPVVGTLGIDNIHAAPEPATLMLLAGWALLGRGRRPEGAKSLKGDILLFYRLQCRSWLRSG